MNRILYVILALAIGFGLSLLGWGVITWAICALLKAIGITTIGTWTVAFSWKLALLLALISSIFSAQVTVKR